MAEGTQTLEMIVDNLLAARKHLKILEAGCGSMSHFKYNKDAYLVGIDISQEQLDKNSMLNERILGDVQNGPLPASHFDLIICWDVLEHLTRPELALKNFAKSVNDRGLILLASPNVLTVRGLLTKLTPHWVHVLYYRHVVGFREAGTPGNYPFRSYHRFAMSPPAIKRFAKKNDLSVELCRYKSWDHPENRYTLLRVVWTLINKLVNALSLGKIGTDEQKGFQMILRKQPGQSRAFR
jgi:SAM-dependent methyltransferase